MLLSDNNPLQGGNCNSGLIQAVSQPPHRALFSYKSLPLSFYSLYRSITEDFFPVLALVGHYSQSERLI